MPVRGILVDDHQMFVDAVASLLRAQGVVDVVATATTARDGAAAASAHRPDLLILDLALPDASGLDVVAALSAANPEAKTIVLSGQAVSFVCPPHLACHIHSVIDKTRAFTTLQREVERLFPTPADAGEPAPSPKDLTLRETQVFTLIGRGRTNVAIATELGISVRTVETHRKNLGRKLGATGADLVRRAALYVPPAPAAPAPQPAER